MERFDRQVRIPRWNQGRIGQSVVAVCGRDWLGAFTVWGLASLGVGEILWIGRPQTATDRMARWFLAQPCPFDGCAIYDYPFDIEYGGGKGVEYKKFGTIVNCLPAGRPDKPEEVDAQCQFEISGPGKPGPSGARQVSTFQYQVEFMAQIGRELALIDEPTRKIAVRIDDATP